MPLDLAVLAAFVVAATAIVVSPGPDTMLIVRSALTGGRPVGFAAVAGVQLGLLVHTALAAAGVSAIIASSPVLFHAMAICGAAYLGWLGIQGLRTSGPLSLGSGAAGSPLRAARDAAVCNILNPKVIVLFLALYPNFVGSADGTTRGLLPASVPVQVAVLSAVLIGINVAWQTLLVAGANMARRWLTRVAVQHAVARITGAILLVFAAGLLWDHLG
jgi:homoserine/homoserine lactone efflux protein